MTDEDSDDDAPRLGHMTDGYGPAQAPTDGEFGWQGWVLVGGLVVALIVVPWSLVALPTAQGFVESLGLGLRDAYLVLPLVPAFGLGALGVWAALSARRD